MTLDVDELADRVADRVVERLGQQPDERPPMSARQVAERLNLSERTVRDMLDRGVLKSFQLGSGQWKRYVDHAEVERYLAEQRARS